MELKIENEILIFLMIEKITKTTTTIITLFPNRDDTEKNRGKYLFAIFTRIWRGKTSEYDPNNSPLAI
jgi:hypothetical protein